MKQATNRWIDPGRRSFLRGKLLTRQGREKARRQEWVLGPPPPALATGLIPDNPCEYCGHPCVASCEAEIIRLHPDEHVYRGMPYLSFESTGCTACDACVEVCPLPPEDVPGEARRVLGMAMLEHGTCLAWNGVICQSCVRPCPVQALGINRQRQLQIDATLCTGCGMCITACPVNALKLAWQSSP